MPHIDDGEVMRSLDGLITWVYNTPDPIERLDLLDSLRESIGHVLTSEYERACFDARVAGREEEAYDTGLSKAAFRDYTRRWNGRFEGAARVRWSDPLGIHRRDKVRDLTKVAKGETPQSIRTGFRESKGDTP